MPRFAISQPRWWWGAVLLAGLGGAVYAARPARPNVVLITVESLRADWVSFAGGPVTTPNIDALASSGVVLTQTFADTPWTRGAMASVMTGTSPIEHHVRSPFDRLPESLSTLAELLDRARYATAAVIGTCDLDHVFGLNRGFRQYDDRYDDPVVGDDHRRAHFALAPTGAIARDRDGWRKKLHRDALRRDAGVTAAAIAQLRRLRRRPFFLWVDYAGPHERAATDRVADWLDAYGQGVRSADDAIGELLNAIAAFGLRSRTLVILHGSGGAGLLDHGGYMRGTDLYEENLHVPLVLSWPDHIAGGSSDAQLTALSDLYATILDAAGVRAPTRSASHDLFASIADGVKQPDRLLYAETYLSAMVDAGARVIGPNDQPLSIGFVRRALRGTDWKYIVNEPGRFVDAPDLPVPPAMAQAWHTEELYDLRHDPKERDNRIAREPQRNAEMRDALQARVQSGR